MSELFDYTKHLERRIYGFEEREERMRIRIEKLEELVRDMYTFIALNNALRDTRISARGKDTLSCERFRDRIAELGIEVSE